MTLESIFGVKKPIIGMVHLANLYSPQGLDYVISRALVDAHNLHLGGKGVDALLVENWEEKSNSPFVAEETAKRMSSVIEAIVTEVDAVIGVNVLPNDYRAAFRIARQQGLSFVLLNVYTDGVVDFADFQKHRRGANAAVFVNIRPRGSKALTDSVKTAIGYGADGVVVSNATGGAQDLAKVEFMKTFAETYKPSFPVIVGSGMTPRLAPKYLNHADGAIVGSYFKVGGITSNPVDSGRVEEFMRAVPAQFR